MVRTATTREEIEHQLRLGLVPAADNVAVLREMGFEPLYPHVNDGYHERLWGRQIDIDNSQSGAKCRAIQRAVLEEAKAAA